MGPIVTAALIVNAPGWQKVLVAPHERVLWPILILVAVFAIWGVWMGRTGQRRDREGHREARRDDEPERPADGKPG